MSSDWLLWLLAGLLVLYGLVLQWWAVLANRNMDGRRCPRCWYDMSGTAGRTCSECGRKFRSEQQLYRRPPRWKVFALGVVMLFAAAYMTKAARDGLMPTIPTRLLAYLAPHNSGVIEEEFTRRVGAGDVSSDLLQKTVARWIDQDDPPWDILLETREGWWKDAPLHVAARFDMSPTGYNWIDGCRFRVRLVPTFGDREPLVLTTRGPESERTQQVGSELMTPSGHGITDLDWPIDWRRYSTRLGEPPMGGRTVDFKAVIEICPPKRSGRTSTYTEIQQTTITLPTQVKETVEEAMTPVTLPDDVDTESYLGLQIVIGPAVVTQLPGRSRRNLRGSDSEHLLIERRMIDTLRPRDGVVVALALDLLLDDMIVATSWIAWEESPTLEHFMTQGPLTWRESPVDFAIITPEDRSRWTARARFDAEQAMRFFDASECLAIDGEMAIPIGWRDPPARRGVPRRTRPSQTPSSTTIDPNEVADPARAAKGNS